MDNIFLQPPPGYWVEKDWLGELDNLIKGLEINTKEVLLNNLEYQQLSNQLQGCIQTEIIGILKNKLNTNPDVISNIKKQIDIIKDTQGKLQEEQRKNLEELNDYMKNYSHLTFDEYKKNKLEK